jgi:hypothetical protein
MVLFPRVEEKMDADSGYRRCQQQPIFTSPPVCEPVMVLGRTPEKVRLTNPRLAFIRTSAILISFDIRILNSGFRAQCLSAFIAST